VVEIKRSSSPKVSKGFHFASEDIKATRKLVIYDGEERTLYPMALKHWELWHFYKS